MNPSSSWEIGHGERFHAEATVKRDPRLRVITLAEVFAEWKPGIPDANPSAAREEGGARGSLP